VAASSHVGRRAGPDSGRIKYIMPPGTLASTNTCPRRLGGADCKIVAIIVCAVNGGVRTSARTLKQGCFRRRRSLVIDDACFLSGAINARAEPPPPPPAHPPPTSRGLLSAFSKRASSQLLYSYLAAMAFMRSIMLAYELTWEIVGASWEHRGSIVGGYAA